jgi:thiamine-monophosphate kinase
MNVSDLGEFGLIERLRAALPSASSDRLIVGIGDDAAVWRNGDGYTVATTDTMVAGIHFLPGAVAWHDVGWKALATNISDIAAMGATPACALVTLCLTPDAALDDIDALYAGLRQCADAYGVTIAGGDIVSAPVFAITIALTGDAGDDAEGKPLLLRRDAANAGDVVAVTSPLGGSAGGLRALTDGGVQTEVRRSLIQRHMRPRPRIDAGRAAIDAGIRCAIDISDGLAQDLGHVCAASSVGAEVRLDRVPLDANLVAAFPADAAMMALTGGEDYELLLIGSEDAISRTGESLGSPLTIVGKIVYGEPRVRVLDATGADIALPSGGWDHFGKDRPK